MWWNCSKHQLFEQVIDLAMYISIMYYNQWRGWRHSPTAGPPHASGFGTTAFMSAVGAMEATDTKEWKDAAVCFRVCNGSIYVSHRRHGGHRNRRMERCSSSDHNRKAVSAGYGRIDSMGGDEGKLSTAVLMQVEVHKTIPKEFWYKFSSGIYNMRWRLQNDQK